MPKIHLVELTLSSSERICAWAVSTLRRKLNSWDRSQVNFLGAEYVLLLRLATTLRQVSWSQRQKKLNQKVRHWSFKIMRILSTSEYSGRRRLIFASRTLKMSKSTSDLTRRSQIGQSSGVKSAKEKQKMTKLTFLRASQKWHLKKKVSGSSTYGSA